MGVCYDSNGKKRAHREPIVNFNKSTDTRGQCIQIFDCNEHEIYRFLLSTGEHVSLESIRVVNSHGTQLPAGVVLLHTYAKTGERLPVLSIELPCGNHSFDVLMGKTLIARVTSKLYRQLIAERDFAMVNPAIDGAYQTWLENHEMEIEQAVSDARNLTSKLENTGNKPLFSIIVPLFRTPIPYFHDMIRSVLDQVFSNWELILVNASPEDDALTTAIQTYTDPRIHVVPLAENLGIAGNTNEGIRAARGRYICFFDHDDILDARILSLYAAELARDSHIDLLYCDEDNFHEELADRYSPLLKPDFNLDLLYSHNYVVHMLTVSRTALEQVELSPDSTSGAQDYDLTLKIAEVARKIKHVPYVLYHWRAHAGSTNGGIMSSKPYAIAASVEALSSHFERRGINVEVEPSDITCVFTEHYRAKTTTLDVVLTEPAEQGGNDFADGLTGINITINQISAVTLESCLYENAAPFALIAHPSVRFVDSAQICELVGCLERTEVGAVAPKLLYGDGLVQHSGIVIDEAGMPRFINQNFTAHMGGGYHGLAECSCNYTALGPDCLLVHTEQLRTFLETKGIETANRLLLHSPLAFSLELCESIRHHNQLVAVLPHIHAEVDAPVIWNGCPVELAYRLTPSFISTSNADVLAMHGVSFVSGYPQLKVVRDRDAAIARMVRGSKYAAIIQPIKRLLHR